MADSTTNESLSEIVPKVVGKYLYDTVTELEEWFDEFPSSNIKLNMPSISVFVKNTEFKPSSQPYKLKAVEAGEIVNSKAPVNYVVGEKDFSLQLDIWGASKEEVDDIFDTLFNALNPKIIPMGLTLPMEEYYNINCDYLYVGHTRGDSEISSQTDEWKLTLDILATCKVVRSSKEFIMETTIIQSEINSTVVI